MARHEMQRSMVALKYSDFFRGRRAVIVNFNSISRANRHVRETMTTFGFKSNDLENSWKRPLEN
jgi:hypothetical protein